MDYEDGELKMPDSNIVKEKVPFTTKLLIAVSVILVVGVLATMGTYFLINNDIAIDTDTTTESAEEESMVPILSSEEVREERNNLIPQTTFFGEVTNYTVAENSEARSTLAPLPTSTDNALVGDGTSASGNGSVVPENSPTQISGVVPKPAPAPSEPAETTTTNSPGITINSVSATTLPPGTELVEQTFSGIVMSVDVTNLLILVETPDIVYRLTATSNTAVFINNQPMRVVDLQPKDIVDVIGLGGEGSQEIEAISITVTGVDGIDQQDSATF